MNVHVRKVDYSKQFRKDWAKASKTVLAPAIEELMQIVRKNPFQTPPPFEKLKGDEFTYSRRINQQHRLVYELDGNDITFLRCWSHYE